MNPTPRGGSDLPESDLHQSDQPETESQESEIPMSGQPALANAASTASTDEDSLDPFIASLGLSEVADLQGYTPLGSFVSRFGIGYSRDHQLLAVQHDGHSYIACCNRDGWDHLDIVVRALGESLTPIAVKPGVLSDAINHAYSSRNSQAQQVLDSLDRSTIMDQLAALDRQEDLLDTEGRAPIIRLVNHLLFDAVKAGASDVHIQPYDDRVVVRQRIDGVLFDSFDIPKSLQEEVLTRIKVLGKMNIAEKRLPQDGRATVQLGERVVDLRIASLPTSHNERIVIRLLDKSARLYTLNELGMPPSTLQVWQRLIRRDHGLILVTGPTGSGKSTTLYGALQEINTTDLNVLTLEDPIEYQLQGISQTQINEKKGMTFASGMRSVLRQDPDIIMVGEIRDSETAEMAIQASLTGHLVFSTLHTNDAASAVTRLLDLGIEPYLVASSLVASLAQRLVRQLCSECKQPSNGEEETSQFQPVGCPACRETGYRGRLGLFELLVVDDRCRELVQSQGNASEIRQAALDVGMKLLASDGLNKVNQGQTTQAEVLRVTSLGEEIQ
jgi:general secretion pathway protein E